MAKRKPPKRHHRGPGPRPADRCAPKAAVGAAPPPDPDPRPAGAYLGPFGPAQATRLLERAGFGAIPGQAEQLAGLGLVGAVQSLTRPSGGATLRGPLLQSVRTRRKRHARDVGGRCGRIRL